MVVRNLNHVSVGSRDLAESVSFYDRLFEMEKIATPNFGYPVQWLAAGPLQIHLFQHSDEPPVRQHFALSVSDFDAVFERAGELGVLDSETFGSALVELPGGEAQMYVRDPSGNLVEIDFDDVTKLAEKTRATMVRLADIHPQSDENKRATLFRDGSR